MGMLHIIKVILMCLACVHLTFTEQDRLPPPENVFIASVNLIHILHWEPLPNSWQNVTYSVQSQGEYERLHKNNTWNDADQCGSISDHQCNVTSDVATNVLYAFRVRSEQGGDQISEWTEMEDRFQRKNTTLIPPNIILQVYGQSSVRVHIEDLGNFQYFVYFWQKDEEDQTMKSTGLSRGVTSTFFDQLAAGKEHCAYVIALAIPISKNTSRSDSVCVKVPALQRTGLIIIGLLFALVFALVPLALAARKLIKVMKYSCCPKVDIPDALKELYGGQKTNNIYYAGQEKCEPMNNVEVHDLITSQEYIRSNHNISR